MKPPPLSHIVSRILLSASLLSSTTLAHAQAAANWLPEQFGAIADGIHLNTKAIQQAIDRCSAQGGGVVQLRHGVYLSGPLQLKNRVDLHLDSGAVLRASNQGQPFRAAFISSAPQPGEAFILANQVHDVALSGNGIIDGNGSALWWPAARRSKQRIRQGDRAFFLHDYPGVPLANGLPRPWLIEFNQVTDGFIGSLTATNSPMWNIVLRHSQRLKLDGTIISNPADSPNTDGIDIVSSQQISIQHVDIATGDDHIAIKSGLPGSLLDTRPSKQISISDSRFGPGHGVSIGSETANGIQEITIRSSRFEHSENGIRIKSGRDRGATISHILAEDLRMYDVKNPITMTDHYSGQSGDSGSEHGLAAVAAEAVTASTPWISHVLLRNIQAENAQTAAVIYGLPEAPIQQITLENIRIQSNKHGLLAAYAPAIRLHKVTISTPTQPAIMLGPQASVIRE